MTISMGSLVLDIEEDYPYVAVWNQRIHKRLQARAGILNKSLGVASEKNAPSIEAYREGKQNVQIS
jgi:hypothetical protein